jgi:allantoate deiminase
MTDLPPAAMAARIVSRVEELARISETPDKLTRMSFSPEHRRAAGLILGWMREAGMSARMDEIGNVVGRLEGATPGLPCLMLGSHLDTVRDAGMWDGPLGIITAIECVGAVARLGLRLPFALEVIGLCDEEGVRFSSTLLGSRAVADRFDPALLDAVDENGVSLRAALHGFGLDPAQIGRAARRRGDVLAYVELHIEQGPLLEAAGLPVGVVTAISGASRFRIELEGMAGHAGTVPMPLRRDALAGAAECIIAIERICRGLDGVVGTVGQIAAEPGAVNVISGSVRFTADIRAADDSRRAGAVAAVIGTVEEAATRRQLALRIINTHDGAAAACAPWLRAQLRDAVAAAGFEPLELASGAGHDGMAMIHIAHIAMLFVRCRGGVSHHPDEHVEPADVAAGMQALLHFIKTFRPRPA